MGNEANEETRYPSTPELYAGKITWSFSPVAIKAVSKTFRVLEYESRIKRQIKWILAL